MFKKLILSSTIAFSSMLTMGTLLSEPVEVSAASKYGVKSDYKTTQYVNSSDGLNIRESHSPNAKKIITAKNGAQVVTKYKIVNKDGSTWVYGTVSGKSGWMNAKYLKVNNQTKDSNSNASVKNQVTNISSKLISAGMKLTGVKYLWGGTTTKGFDCSGFTQYVFKNAIGKTIPRTAAAQYSASQKISKSQAKEGDLVFFSSNGKSVTHVAIYAGNDKLLHATSSNGVMLGKLNNGYWNKRLVGFGRI